MKWLRSHLTYANVVATLALVFAMSGGALAANHYLINSTRQINPKVLNRLRGRAGPRGLSGPRGATGATGATGAEGSKGSQGATGPQGPRGEQGTEGPEGPEGPEGASALTDLEAGSSESGVYGIAAERSSGGHLATAVTFSKPLTATIPVANFVYTPSSTPVTHCAGPGKADPGYLCVYSSLIEGLLNPQLVDPETAEVGVRTGKLGFALKWKATGSKAIGEEELDFGTYTVTAP